MKETGADGKRLPSGFGQVFPLDRSHSRDKMIVRASGKAAGKQE
jgi:hypothetical protein